LPNAKLQGGEDVSGVLPIPEEVLVTASLSFLWKKKY
jgi:hypothetical protein